MESARVCVIDSSPTIRETIAIVLGGDHTVWCLTPDDYLRSPSAASNADLLIVGDDALPTESVRLLPPGRPVLWLQSRAGASLATTGRTSIARWFSPEDLRIKVHGLLTDATATPPAFDGWSALDFPMLPRDTAQLARRAVATRLPVLVCGEPGTGKVRLARAIHAAAQNGRLVHLSPSTCTRAGLQQAGGINAGHVTLLVQDVAGLAADAQQLLLELLDCGGFASDAGWHPVRLICGTAYDLPGLARSHGLDRDLYYRLSVLPLILAPLRERAGDIPALVNRIAADIARSLAAKPVTFTERAIQRLTHYLWFGNLAELETVLTRTVALAPGQTIDAEDLLFGYGRIAPRERDEVGSTGRREAREPVGGETVDMIINELAHEFKNPMVTIKTVAQHMERLLEDQEGRQDVARLTGEAVDRMDRVLENLLQFTRFRAPCPHDVPLKTLLTPCLSNLAPQLSERGVTLDYRPPDARSAFVDAEQIEYALDNLLRVIARDLGEGQTLSIQPQGHTPALTFTYTKMGSSLTGKLAALLDGSANGGEAQPLGLVLAQSLIERNGGRVETRSGTDATTVTVWLPSREPTATGSGNGKAASPSS